MEQNPSSVSDLSTTLATTIMAPVIDIMMSGKFTPALTIPVGDEETVIGELTVFEKSLDTAIDNIANQHNAWVGVIEKSEDDILLAGKNRQLQECFTSLFWISIMNRVGTMATEGKKLAIREGYKIVALPPRKKQFHDIISGMHIVGIEFSDMEAGTELFFSHDCSNCDPEKYARCNLPFKNAHQ